MVAELAVCQFLIYKKKSQRPKKDIYRDLVKWWQVDYDTVSATSGLATM